MFKDRAFQNVSKRCSVPDHPPRHYFNNKDDCPTPLHNPETGLVKPEYLAYLCSQLVDENSEMLKPKYHLELTHLALVLYVNQNPKTPKPQNPVRSINNGWLRAEIGKV